MGKAFNFSELATVHVNLEPDGVTVRTAQLEAHEGGEHPTRLIDIHVNKLNLDSTEFEGTGIVAEVTILARIRIY